MALSSRLAENGGVFLLILYGSFALYPDFWCAAGTNGRKCSLSRNRFASVDNNGRRLDLQKLFRNPGHPMAKIQDKPAVYE